MTESTATSRRYAQDFEDAVLERLGRILEIIDNPPKGPWVKGCQIWQGRFASQTAFKSWLNGSKAGKRIRRREGGYYHVADLDDALNGESWRGDGQPVHRNASNSAGTANLKKGRSASSANRKRSSPSVGTPMLKEPAA